MNGKRKRGPGAPLQIASRHVLSRPVMSGRVTSRRSCPVRSSPVQSRRVPSRRSRLVKSRPVRSGHVWSRPVGKRYAGNMRDAIHVKYFRHGSFGSVCGAETARRVRLLGSRPSSLPKERNCASFAATIPCGSRSNAACNATHMCARGASICASHAQRRIYMSHNCRCLLGNFTGGSMPLSDARSTGRSRGILRCSRLPSTILKAGGLGFRPAIAKAVSPSWSQPLLPKLEILKSDNAYEPPDRSEPPFIGRDLHTPCPL